MNFLVLDTSSAYCSIALKADGKVYSDTRHIPRQHNKYLLEMIDELFKAAAVDRKSLDFIAYGVGPGSFVGVRLAASACQAFAVALDIPIIGFSSMFAIAKSTPTNSDKVAVILDAKMGDFYLGLYDKSTNATFAENVYKLDEYSTEMFADYQTVGEAIKQIEFEPNISEFKLDVANIIEYIENEYNSQKAQDKLTHETYPVYLRGAFHWAKKL